jgi:two-component system cell cycle sensor histidine kinase/response regulator CckA
MRSFFDPLTANTSPFVLVVCPDGAQGAALARLAEEAGADSTRVAASVDESAGPLPGRGPDVVLAAPGTDVAALVAAAGPTPVVAVVDREEDEEAALAAGATEVLPLAEATPAALRRAFRRAARNAGAGRGLREARHALAGLLGNLPGMVYRCRNDRRWSMEWVSPRSLELTGYRAEQLTSGAVEFSSLIHPADRERVWGQVQAAVARGIPFRITYRIRTTQGEEKWVCEEGAAVAGDAGVAMLEGFIRDVTGQVHAEAGLRESEQRLMSLFDNHPDAVFSLDLEGRVTALNPAAARMAGAPREQILGHPYEPLVAEEERPALRERLARVMAGEPQTYEVSLAAPALGAGRVQVTSIPMVVEGQVVGVYGIAQDVTGARAAEQHLRLRDRALAAVAEGIVITDAHLPDNPVVSVNPAFERLTGYPAAEALGRNCRFLQGPGTNPISVAEIHAAVAEGLPCSAEVLNYRADGQPFWNFVSISPVRDEAGRLTHFIGVLNDVTERRETEEALRSREAHFRSLIENAQDIITVLEGDGTVRFASPAAERVLGYTRAELEGVELPDLVHPDDTRLVAAALEEAVMNPATPRWVELRVRHRGGEWRILEIVGTSLLHDPGVMGIVLNARDVTARRQAEGALAESRLQFLQAQKMEAVGRLAGGVAHDFNNLLTAIRGNADLLLLDPTLGEGSREDVTEIRRAADRAAALTRQLLAFSRRQVLQPRVLDLNGVVLDMERMLSRLVGAGVRIATVLAPRLGRTLADAGQVEQVVMNLVVNARDAMPEGGVVTVETADVELTADDQRRLPYVVPGRYVRLRVRDTGHGMDAETCAAAFEPFFTTKPPGQGTGLGLSTVYGIVKQSGGYVWIESEPGRGTAVSVHLPATDAAAGEESPREGADAAHPGRGETVLVVEDEVAVRNLAARVLARAGYHVLEANDGFEALRLAHEMAAPPHLLLTDVAMPRMGGRELARRMRELLPSVRVLYVTANPAELDGADAGGAPVVEKPFTTEGLVRQVREVLDGAS